MNDTIWPDNYDIDSIGKREKKTVRKTVQTKDPILDLVNWNESIQGLYTYSISDYVWFEIHISQWLCKNDPLTAKANLKVVAYAEDKKKNTWLKRFVIAKEHTVEDCLQYALEEVVYKTCI